MVSPPARVLVTGATGFVGREIIPALRQAGYQVRATTRGKLPSKATPGVEWVRCDIEKLGDVRRALRGVQITTMKKPSTWPSA